jgi:hypothetical protein
MLTALSYVGTRPYIRGADLYAWFERQIASALPPERRPARILRFKLGREVARDGQWVAGSPADAAATLEIAEIGGAASRYGFRETGDAIVRRDPDLPSLVESLARDADFAGTARLRDIRGTVDFLNGLIEANKRLHAETLAAKGRAADRIRLIYVERLPATGFDGAPRRLDLRYLGGRDGADRTYSLVAVAIDGADGGLRICYSY